MDGGIERSSETPETSEEKSYTEIFEEHFPYYLAVGMTYDQYWNDDVELVKYYRKADEFRKERANQEAWLQGAYFYEALCRVSPILRAFSKADEPSPYPDRPYALTQKEQEEREKQKEEAEYKRSIELFKQLVKQHNQNFEASVGGQDERSND